MNYIFFLLTVGTIGRLVWPRERTLERHKMADYFFN